MTTKIIPFGKERIPIRNEKQSQPDGRGESIPGRLHAVLELSVKRGYYSERLPSEGKAREFFAHLLSTKTLYIVQKNTGDIQGTDTVYVMKDPDDAEGEKNEMTVKDFYGFTGENPKKLVHYGVYLSEYTTKYGYIIGIVDDNEEEEEDMTYVNLGEVVHFHPESIPMIDSDEVSGYSYVVIEKLGDVLIPAENFISTESYTPPLLFLLIDAAELIGKVTENTDSLLIVRYQSGSAPSLSIEMNFGDFLSLIDASILRGYPLLPAKYDTAEKRRSFIHETFVKKNLDPQFMGGRMMIEGENEE